MERGRIHGLYKVFKYPLLSQERVKLWTSNGAGTYTLHRVHSNKSPLKENGAWAYPGAAHNFKYPYYLRNG